VFFPASSTPENCGAWSPALCCHVFEYLVLDFDNAPDK
jgi:hypothetical protein